MAQARDYDSNAYLAVTLVPASHYLVDPAALVAAHPALAHVGPVGALSDVQLYSVSRQEWEHAREEIIGTLRTDTGVARVDVQELSRRTKRGGDEL